MRSPLARLPRPAAALALVALAACEDLAAERARVMLRYREVAPLTRERLVVTLRDDQREWYVEGIDLTPAADGWLVGRELRTGTTGPLTVRFALRGSGEDPLSAGEVEIPLAPRARWRIDIFPSSETPTAACADCTGVRRFRIADGARPSAQDWLYFTWTAATPPSASRSHAPTSPETP